MSEENKNKIDKQLIQQAAELVDDSFSTVSVKKSGDGMRLSVNSEYGFVIDSDHEFYGYVLNMIEKLGGNFETGSGSGNKFSCNGKWQNLDVKVVAKRNTSGIKIDMDFTCPVPEQKDEAGEDTSVLPRM